VREKGLLNSFIRFETIITAIQFLGLANLGRPYMATGRNLAYRKKIFLENKGFNSHLSIMGGDDDLFVNEHATGSNTCTVLNAKSIVNSLPKKTWKAFFRQKTRHLAVGRRYRFSSRLMLAPFTLSWILFWPIMITGLLSPFWQWTLGCILARFLAMFFTISTFNNKTGEEFERWKILLLDFIFCFYYLVAGFSALITKRIQWKKT